MADLSDLFGAEEPESVRERQLRILEAVLFASAEPLGEGDLLAALDGAPNLAELLAELQALYGRRGINLVRRGEGWAFRTAPDLAFLLRREEALPRPLSRAAIETLAVIAYHQPTTRAEIEEVRGVSIARGTLDLLMETGWVRMRGRRRTPGRPVTYGTTDTFLDHFGLESLTDLPGLDELKGAGLLSPNLPPAFQVPLPFDGSLRDDEDPLDDRDEGAEVDDPASDGQEEA